MRAADLALEPLTAGRPVISGAGKVFSGDGGSDKSFHIGIKQKMAPVLFEAGRVEKMSDDGDGRMEHVSVSCATGTDEDPGPGVYWTTLTAPGSFPQDLRPVDEEFKRAGGGRKVQGH